MSLETIDPARMASAPASAQLDGGAKIPLRPAVSFSSYSESLSRPTHHEWVSSLRDPSYCARREQPDCQRSAAPVFNSFHEVTNDQ